MNLPRFLPTFNIYVAQQGGYFEAEGLDVELVYVQSNDLVGQAVESGEVDLGARNYDGIFKAVSEGFQWQALYPHVLYSSDAPDAQLMVRSDLWDDGPEAAAKALEGEPIAVPVGTQSWMALQVYLEHHWDVDPGQLEFVEVPFGETLASFDRGTIAAAHVIEPFVAQIEEADVARSLGPHVDAVALLPPHGNGTRRFVIHTSFSTTEWIEENTDSVERFVRAMDAATADIIADPEQFTELAVEYTELDPEVVDQLYPRHYVVATPVTRDEAEAVLRFNVETGLIEDAPILDSVLADAFPIEE